MPGSSQGVTGGVEDVFVGDGVLAGTLGDLSSLTGYLVVESLSRKPVNLAAYA